MLRKIRRIIGNAEHVTTISDEHIYEENEKSYTGGSLAGSNVLIVSNIRKKLDSLELLENTLNIEQCGIIKRCLISDMDKKSIDEQLGNIEESKFEHIINWVENISGNEGYVNCDVKLLYFLLQAECNYLISNGSYGTICTAIISDMETDTSFEAEVCGMKSLINGLGYFMPKHEIIVNGVLAEQYIPLEEIIHTIIYLSGKYGQILTGEVLRMEKRKG